MSRNVARALSRLAHLRLCFVVAPVRLWTPRADALPRRALPLVVTRVRAIGSTFTPTTSFNPPCSAAAVAPPSTRLLHPSNLATSGRSPPVGGQASSGARRRRHRGFLPKSVLPSGSRRQHNGNTTATDKRERSAAAISATAIATRCVTLCSPRLGYEEMPVGSRSISWGSCATGMEVLPSSQ